MNAASVTLDIFSDPVCPWCLIGKAELDRALESRPEHPFLIAWHPFQLNPDMPAEGMDRDAYLRAKFGEGGGVGMMSDFAARAAALGIPLGPVTHQPNTFDAHRLTYWAGIEGAQTRVTSALLRCHWQEGGDISDHDTLTAIAKKVGMDGELVARLLASDADKDTVAARETHARDRGLSAVPTFIVSNQHVVPGAQPAAFWQQVIDELAGAAQPESETPPEA